MTAREAARLIARSTATEYQFAHVELLNHTEWAERHEVIEITARDGSGFWVHVVQKEA